MKYLGDEFLKLHDLLGKLPKDVLLPLSREPFYVQPLNPKEYALMFSNPSEGILPAIKQIMVNKIIYKNKDETEKYRKILRDQGWTFLEDETVDNSKMYG